jgi:hypothetical protein
MKRPNNNNKKSHNNNFDLHTNESKIKHETTFPNSGQTFKLSTWLLSRYQAKNGRIEHTKASAAVAAESDEKKFHESFE